MNAATCVEDQRHVEDQLQVQDQLRVEDQIDWSAPDYTAIYKKRAERYLGIRGDARAIAGLRAYYREHIADWIADWCITYDPRAAAKNSIADRPFVLFPKQREWVEFTFQNWRDGAYGGTEKSRDVGLSWLAVAFSIALATLYNGIAVGLGSFSEEKVDVRGNMGSLFEKVRYLLRNLPAEFRAGYDESTCSRERLIIFPATGGSIFGEIGDNIGRGNRASIYFVDEAAYLVHDEMVEAALSKTTPCRQDLSSVRGMRNSFARRMHDGFSRKFTFHWRHNPMYSEEDYRKFLKDHGPVITAQELDIDYLASIEGVVIPQLHVQAAIDAHKKLTADWSGIKRGGLDIADLGRDLNAFASRHGNVLIDCRSWRGSEKAHLGVTVERCFLICDELGLDGFDYDADGGGSHARGFISEVSERRAAQGLFPKSVGAYRGSGEVLDPDGKIPGSDRTPKDTFQNFKAQAMSSLAARFANTYRAVNGEDYDADNLISLSSTIAELPQLCVELSQAVWKISANGKFMVDKTPEGMRSPNLADAVCITFAPRDFGIEISDEVLNYEPEFYEEFE